MGYLVMVEFIKYASQYTVLAHLYLFFFIQDVFPLLMLFRFFGQFLSLKIKQVPFVSSPP